MLRYQRILIKLSGESLMGTSSNSINPETVAYILQQIKEVVDLGAKIGVVIGGGNFFRGVSGCERLGIKRANADLMGMLATAMNGVLLRDAFNNYGITAELFSAFPIGSMINGYNQENMLKHMAKGSVAIFVGGVGSPYFTTDSGAALRALEMNADILIKATKVDGIYNADPYRDPSAKKFTKISFDEALAHNLGVMDTAAFALCRENQLPINVCSIFKQSSLKKIALGEEEGTLVYCS